MSDPAGIQRALGEHARPQVLPKRIAVKEATERLGDPGSAPLNFPTTRGRSARIWRRGWSAPSAHKVCLPPGRSRCATFVQGVHVFSRWSYEELIGEGHLALGWEPQQDWLAAHIHLAELYLSGNRVAEVRQLVSAIAGVWGEADPDVPLARRVVRLREKLER